MKELFLCDRKILRSLNCKMKISWKNINQYIIDRFQWRDGCSSELEPAKPSEKH